MAEVASLNTSIAGEGKQTTSQRKGTSASSSTMPGFTNMSRKPSNFVDDYFYGPRDLDRHSKWPTFMRLHGSILPEMLLPLLLVGAWATTIRCISQYVHNLGVNPILLTVLGFVVALGLSFRSSTAYERYSEGRKYWSQLSLAAHSMARVIWIHGIERPGDEGKEDILKKRSALNLVVALSVALKHRVRHEPFTHYNDLNGYVSHLDTFAGAATKANPPTPQKKNLLKSVGQYLGVSFAESNPMKAIKKCEQPLGNLPLEILSYLAAFVDDMVDNGQLKVPMQQTTAYNALTSFNDVITGCDRILRTPLALAYKIAISQITWMYIMVLPFQLENALRWVMIPAAVFAAYIILGILMIGQEIENPFGEDVNDLPLEQYCQQIATDLDIISSRRKPNIKEIMACSNNKVLFPLSQVGYTQLFQGSEETIRKELKYKAGRHEEKQAKEGAHVSGAQTAYDA